MWVRSQDNKMLINCDTFKVEVEYRIVAGSSQTEEHHLITNDIMQGYPLADYPTAEQAFKILDMLQKHMFLLEKARWINTENITPVLTEENYVFQFPQASVKKSN